MLFTGLCGRLELSSRASKLPALDDCEVRQYSWVFCTVPLRGS